MSWQVTADNSGSGNSELPTPANHPGVLIGLIDLGTHEDEYQGKVSEVRKVLLCWELPAEHRSDGSPFIVIQDFNFMPKLGTRSKLRKMLEGWRGRPLDDGEQLDLEVLLLKPCLINVVHGKSQKGNAYVQIDGIKPPPKGMTVPKPLSDPYEWNFAAPYPFQAPDWLPFLYGKPVQGYIDAALENHRRGVVVGAGVAAPANGAAGADQDDSPF